METSGIKKLTYIVNTAILIMVLGLMIFFAVCKATFLVYFSIPTALIYVFGYLIISKNKLYLYVVIVYCWITIYMGVCTICLGYDYGFHLYGMSMIPIIFYTDYMGYRIGSRRVNPFIFSAMIVICYLICTLTPYIVGPLYPADKNIARAFWIVNSIIVFAFLIFYTSILIRMIIQSEERLKDIAHKDSLTKIYNRHFMMSQLEKVESAGQNGYIAMVDIDGFKGINDEYGHNAGDLVLQKLAEIMKETCKDYVTSRWGGEEFLILLQEESGKEKLTDEYVIGQMNKLRSNVEASEFSYEDKSIKVTVTIGVAEKSGWPTIERWVDAADDKLYEGKKTGKNKVVM